MTELRDFRKVLIRTPLYSWHHLFNADGSTTDLHLLVHKYLDEPVFLEAIYWSSPLLFERVQKLKQGRLTREKEKHLLNTLKKYIIRAHTRSTPYGIFAGTGISSIGELTIAKAKMERVVLVDSGLLQNIIRRIETDADIYPHLKYHLNDTLYRIPGQFRFTEKIIEDAKTSFQLSSLEATPLLEMIHNLIANKKSSARELFELSDVDATFETFNTFFDNLIKAQFLVSELRQGPTVDNELKGYIRTLIRLAGEGHAKAEKYTALLSRLQTAADNFSCFPLGTLPLDEIRVIKEQLKQCQIDTCQDHLFYANLRKTPPSGFIFSCDQVSEIMKGVLVLGSLSAGKEKVEDYLSTFKTLFVKKYGSNEIPLSEALDAEYGIAFPPHDSIGKILFNPMSEKVIDSDEKEYKFKARAKTDLTYFPTVMELSISDEDVAELKDTDLPSYFSVMGHLLPSGQILMEGVGKMHATALPGRFAGLEKSMLELCKELAEDEQSNDNDVIYAEIAFQPGGRSGNIARRPSFFHYEIPYFATSGVEPDKQLPVSDLLLSVRNNELVLRSSKLNKRVIPRLSNAHNFAIAALPVYQFLSYLQYPDESRLEINWGHPNLKRRYFPRVIYKNLILHRARWYMYPEDISFITGGTDQISLLQDFISKFKIPRLVCLAQGDNELFIDTANRQYVELLLSEMQKSTLIQLVEWSFGIPGNDNNTTASNIVQFIMPLAKKEGQKYFPFTNRENYSSIRQKFVPGSEWIYFKLYCSAGFSDRILMEVVKPSIDHLLKENLLDKAFFVRYTDPHYHIRLRLLQKENVTKSNFGKIIEHVCKRIESFSEGGIIWDTQINTYCREIERYGEEKIIASEEAFFHDTFFFLNFLSHEKFAGNDEIRFFVAVKNLDKWLSLFQLTIEEKISFCDTVIENFAKEFGQEMKYQVDLTYRQLSHVLPTFLESLIFKEEFEERDKKLLKLCLPLKNVSSYIHMSMNRWFVTDQRLMEYMSYVFATKYYKQLIHYHSHKN